MAVEFTEDMYDTFTENGYTEDDMKATVNHLREKGLPDSAIFTKLNKKYRELAGIKDVVTPQMGDQPNYDAILNDPSLTPQQQVEQIKQKGEAYRAGVDKDLATQKAKILTGGIVKIGSPLVGLALSPVTGGMSLPASMATLGLAEGATFGLGEALQNQKQGGDFAKEVATQGLLGGLMGAGTGALFKGASRVLPKVFNRPINVSKDVQELGELAVNPQAYVAKTSRHVGLSRLPKENIQEVVPTVTTTPTGKTQLNVGLQAVEQPVQKSLPPLRDNYLKDLSEYTPILHREMSPAQAMKFVGNINTDMTPEQLYFSNKPELALGQGTNKGIIIEFDSKGIQGQVNQDKPLWQPQYEQGNAEFISKMTPQSVYRQNVKSVTIKPDAKFTTVENRVIKNSLKDWTKIVNDDGSITFIKPVQGAVEQPVSEMVQPLNKQALQKDLNVELRALRNSIELPEVTKGTYVRGRYKNRFYQKNITDDLTRAFIDADNSLLEVTKEIKNNPANALQNMDILENKLIDKVSKLPNEAQQKYYDKFWKDLDIANTHEELSKKALTPEGAGFVADDVINSKQKVTKLSQSILKAKGLPTDIKKTIKQNAPTYESMTNNDLIMTASDAIDKDLMGNLADIMAKDKFNAFDVERTRQIAKRLNAQNTPEANETLINLLDKASEQASKSGQAVQAFSLWNNLTPEGAILKTNKLLNEYNKRFGKNLKLTQEQINNITKLQETAQALPDGYDKDVALAKSLKYQQGLIPKALGSKIKAYRNISLLLNPKTLGRNVVGNALFNTIDTASKTLAVPIDKAMGAFTKTHTRALPQIGESLKGLKLGAERGFKEAMQGINTADVSSRYDLQGGKVFESKVGQAFETALDLGLRVPDRAFYNSVYAESLANQLKASGLKEPTTKMIEQAEKEALEGVFQNKSKLSDIALGLRQQFNRVGSKEFGLGDLLIPYAQTPANLAQQGINYSPLGLLKAGASLKGGNQRQASLDVARALVGTGIGAAGYGAVKAGQATGSMETGKGYQQDLRLRKNMELLGIRPQQLGDISYSQFQPASIPFSVGAATATGESPTQAGINTLLDLPFLQNYNRIMSDVKQDGIAQAGANFAASIPSQFVPTLLGQINQAFDNTTRETYSPNKLQQGLNVAGAKIPFVAQTLPERVNVKGEPIQRYESTGVTRLGDVFLNPTFINKKKDDVVIKQMNKLYQETGEIAPLLPVAQRTIKVNGKQKKLTGKEVNKYQKEVGKISYYLRKKAIESDTFKAMNSDEQIDYLNKMNKGVTQAVKIMMFNDSPKKIQPFAQEIIDNYDTFTK